MRTRIELRSPGGFPWYGKGNCFSRGYVYHNGDFLEGENLNAYFSEIQNSVHLKSVLKTLNGIFSLILRLDDSWYLVQDIIRSFPLYYLKAGSEWVVSDDSIYLQEILEKPELNLLAALEFSGAGYVTGKETLLEGVQQVQAGEILYLGNSEEKGSFYFSYRTNLNKGGSYSGMKQQGSEVFKCISDRLASGLNNRHVAIPLSAGFDSRLIACMLKTAGYEKVLCFTYGRKDGPEVETSRLVAEKLGFRWYFIEYTEELIKDFVNTEEFRNYYPWGAGISSMFFLQEYFALKYLKEVEIIPDETIFIPGHSGDFLGGSQFQKHNFSGIDEPIGKIVDRIFRVKYMYKTFNKQEEKLLKRRIERSLTDKNRGVKDFAYSVHEDWDMKEKLAKFNNNSTGIYSYFGYEFRSPFWDRELVEFFRDLKLEYKLGKKLYDDILSADFFAPHEVRFRDELQDQNEHNSLIHLKQYVKRLLPDKIVDRLVRKEDLLFYREITAELLKDLENEGKDIGFYGNKFNKVIIGWYLEDLKKKISLQKSEK